MPTAIKNTTDGATIHRTGLGESLGGLGALGKYAANALAIHTDKIPKYFIFFVTSRCNATCDFCHYTTQIEDKERKALELSVDEITKIAAQYGKISKLSFSGGEPFIRLDLPEIIDAFIEHCDPQIIDIPTNGSMPDRIERVLQRVLPKLGNRILDIQLSIDGPEAIHDEIRGIPGLFKKVLESYDILSRLRQQHPNLRIKMNLVYVNDNRAATKTLTKFFEGDYDFDRFQITYPHGESVVKNVYDQVNFDEFHKLSMEIQKHFKLRNRGDLHSMLFRAIKMLRDDIIAENHDFLQDMGAICKAGERIIVLDDIGEVFPCEPLWESVGNVRDTDYDLHAILGGERMARFREKHLGPGKCTCSWGCIAMQKAIYTPSLYPRLLGNFLYLLFSGGAGVSHRLGG